MNDLESLAEADRWSFRQIYDALTKQREHGTPGSVRRLKSILARARPGTAEFQEVTSSQPLPPNSQRIQRGHSTDDFGSFVDMEAAQTGSQSVVSPPRLTAKTLSQQRLQDFVGDSSTALSNKFGSQTLNSPSPTTASEQKGRGLASDSSSTLRWRKHSSTSSNLNTPPTNIGNPKQPSQATPQTGSLTAAANILYPRSKQGIELRSLAHNTNVQPAGSGRGRSVPQQKPQPGASKGPSSGSGRGTATSQVASVSNRSPEAEGHQSQGSSGEESEQSFQQDESSGSAPVDIKPVTSRTGLLKYGNQRQKKSSSHRGDGDRK